MSEEGTPPAAPEQATVPTSLVGPDGSLVENWQTHAPEGYEDLREDKSLATQKNLWAMGKSFVHVRKQVPLDKMPRPNENFTDSDWEDYHKAGGRPETPQDYVLKRHDDIPEEAMPQEAIDSFQELLHKHGASKKLSDAIHDWNTDRVLTARKQMTEQSETDATTIKDGLHTLWGAAFDQNVHRGNIAMDKDADFVKDADYAERVKQKVNADPDLVRHLSNIGANFIEHKIIEDPGIPTPGDIQSQIDEEMAKEEYSNAKHPNHKKQIQLVHRLFQKRVEHIKTG